MHFKAGVLRAMYHRSREYLLNQPDANSTLPGSYLGASAAGAAAGAGAGAGAAAGAPAAGCAAAAACGCAFGLIQQAWTRPSRVSATLGSIDPPKRVRQRNAAWTW